MSNYCDNCRKNKNVLHKYKNGKTRTLYLCNKCSSKYKDKLIAIGFFPRKVISGLTNE